MKIDLFIVLLNMKTVFTFEMSKVGNTELMRKVRNS